MKKTSVIGILIGLILSVSCVNRKSISGSKGGDIDELISAMAGKFSSLEQSENDKEFYNISLVMYPIWEKNKEAKWLYVEQAVAAKPKKPYRQRVYKVTETDTPGVFESAVYTLPNPESFIHGWETPELFNSISPESLEVREGCSIFLTKTADGCYEGSTKDKECTSNLMGATYATSKVSICSGSVMSWDQGWDDKDEQVWGAVKSGYIFKAIKE